MQATWPSSAVEGGKERQDAHFQRVRQDFHIIHGDIPFPALDAPDVGPMKSCKVCEGFLRIALLLPNPAEVISKYQAGRSLAGGFGHSPSLAR